MVETVYKILLLIGAVICHEFAHGWVAYKRGDPTAKLAGRLTLNPFKHIDPVGSVLVPIILNWLNLLPLGWARPVPVNFQNLYNPRRDMILVAMAGPATNFLLAVGFSLILRLSGANWVQEFALLGIIINLVLAIFNLMPIPPLDGSRLILGLLPSSAARFYGQLEPYGIIIVLILLNLGFLDFVWKLVYLVMPLLGITID